MESYLVYMVYISRRRILPFLLLFTIFHYQEEEERMAIFKGAGVAIVTPMKENLEINYDKLDEMLEEQIAGGTDAIII